MTQRKITVNKETLSKAPSVFAEGVAALNYSPTISRLSFFQIDPASNEREEQRNVVLTLAIPTHALVEMCINTLAGLKANLEQVESIGRNQHDQVFKLLRNVQVNIENVPLTGVSPDEDKVPPVKKKRG